MERRVLLAFFLSFLVLFGYQSVFVPPPPPTEVPGTDTASEERIALPAAESTAVTADTPPPTPLTSAPGAAVDRSQTGGEEPPEEGFEVLVGADSVETSVVETPAIRAVFSNRGAVLINWQLKQHTEQQSEVAIELVPQDLPPEEARPFTLAFDDPLLSVKARDALFTVSAPSITVGEAGDTLTFEYEDTTGLRLKKAFSFAPAEHEYLMRLTVEAEIDGQPLGPAVQWGPALGGGESGSSGIAYRAGPRGFLFGRIQDGATLGEEDVTRLEASDVAARPEYDGQIQAAGVDNHYFVAAALVERQNVAVGYRSVPLPPVEADGVARDLMAFEFRWADGRIEDVPFFLGPKNFDLLEQVDQNLIQAIDFGWLGWLVVPLHRTLTGIQGYVGNWGWSIIILTFLINVLIFPLRHKSVTSMRKMQEIQPEMKAIQERYSHLKATDPDKQKMNKEVMALYRDRGVNPASGCFPMLLTMPVLFAFYSLLSVAVEIRGEPFVGWITDLTLEDPLYVTPVLMGASMVVQQKMTPSQADPMQQKIMMLMPIMFTGMFLWAPSGLVLYWMTSNVLGIVQTLLTNKVIGPTKTRTLRPAAERRVKQRNKGKGANERQES